MSVIKEIQDNARSYNKHMTIEFLDTLHPLNQLAFVGPYERSDFAMALKQKGIISDDELRHWRDRKNERNKKYNKDGKKPID